MEKNISQGGDPKRERERKRPRRKKDLKEIGESQRVNKTTERKYFKETERS